MKRRKKVVLLLVAICAIPILLQSVGRIWDWTESRGAKEIHLLCADPHNFVAGQEYYGAEAVTKTVQQIRAILDESPSGVSARDRWGRTPLHYAARAEYVELLIARGAEVNARDKEQKTPLHYAAKSACADVARVLLTHGADVDAKDRQGLTPLFWARTGRTVAETFGPGPSDIDPFGEAKAEREKLRAARTVTISLLERAGGTADITLSQEAFKKVVEYNIERAKRQKE